MNDEKGGAMAKAEDIVSQYQTTRIRLLGVAYKRLVSFLRYKDLMGLLMIVCSSFALLALSIFIITDLFTRLLTCLLAYYLLTSYHLLEYSN